MSLRRLFVAHHAARPETCCTAPAATSQFIRGCMVPEAFGLHTATYNLQHGLRSAASDTTTKARRKDSLLLHYYISSLPDHRQGNLPGPLFTGKASSLAAAPPSPRHRTGVRNEINSNNYCCARASVLLLPCANAQSAYIQNKNYNCITFSIFRVITARLLNPVWSSKPPEVIIVQTL